MSILLYFPPDINASGQFSTDVADARVPSDADRDRAIGMLLIPALVADRDRSPGHVYGSTVPVISSAQLLQMQSSLPSKLWFS
jgi:hypothetical protein